MRFPEDVPVLTDGEVTLRPHRWQDVERMVEQCTDPDSVAWTMVPSPYRRSDALHWVGTAVPAGWVTEMDLHLAVEVGGDFAGSVGLRPEPHGPAEVAYGLHPSARGGGVATRAVRLLVRWAFETRGHTAVTWRAAVGNWPSRRVAWACGFHFGPTVPGLLRQRGQTCDAWTGWIGAQDSGAPTCRWLDVPELTVPGARLRAWRDDDADRLVETGSDPRLRRFLPHSPLPTRHDDVRSYLTRVREKAATGTRLQWCVADADSDAALGGVSLFDLEDDDSAQVGFWSHPGGRGRGVISAAVRRVADWALGTEPDGFGLRRLFLLTAVDNTAARRVSEHAGFEHVGTERASAAVGTVYADHALYDRLAGATAAAPSA